jgi:hypothetical protein
MQLGEMKVALLGMQLGEMKVALLGWPSSDAPLGVTSVWL